MPRILIVEDNPRVSEVLAVYLRKKGVETRTAADAALALEALAASPVDLLLVDARLPDMSGVELCRKVRTRTAGEGVPIIMMSGFIRDPAEIGSLTRELRLSSFLQKPFTSDALYALILAALKGPATGPAQPARGSTKPSPSITGDLARTPFEKVLLYLHQNRATGLLTIVREPLTRRFFFIGGAPVEFDAASPGDDFGSYLSSKNLIDAAERDAYEQRRSANEDPRSLFVAMGCLTADRFQEESRSFLHDRLVDCFSWRSGSVLFEGKPGIAGALHAAAALFPAIFYHGLRAHLPASALSSFLDAKGSLYADKAPAFFEYRPHLAAEIGNAELFDLINGVTTISGIITAVDHDDTAVALYLLNYVGALSLSATPKRSTAAPPYPVRTATPRPAAKPDMIETLEDLGEELGDLAGQIEGLDRTPGSGAPAAGTAGADDPGPLEQALRRQWEDMKDKNYYELFGLTQNTFSFEALKTAYFGLTRTYGPEKFFASSGEIMELAEELLSRVANAYTTLSNVVSKENYDALLASQAPSGAEEKKFYEQVQFQSGKVMLEQGQYDGAEKAFSACLTMDPEKPEYQVYLALALYNNPASRDNPAAVKHAKELVNKSLQWEKTAIAYALKGTMLLDEGLLNLAEAEFDKALRLSPTNKTALKRLEQIRQKREEEEKKGFLQRMFK